MLFLHSVMAEEFSIACRVSVSPQEMKINCDANDQFNLRPTLSRGRFLKTGLMEQNNCYYYMARQIRTF